jgi:hypothetical protein
MFGGNGRSTFLIRAKLLNLHGDALSALIKKTHETTMVRSDMRVRSVELFLLGMTGLALGQLRKCPRNGLRDEKRHGGKMAESFAPTVYVKGYGTVAPEGWMWVLGFALGGAQWAIDECRKPEFDLRGRIRDYCKRKKIYEINRCIEWCERELERLRDKRESCSISIEGEDFG